LLADSKHEGPRGLLLCWGLLDTGLQNGSLGRIVKVEAAPTLQDVSEDAGLAIVKWDDGVRRGLTVNILDDVELTYAITVHKAQGSR